MKELKWIKIEDGLPDQDRYVIVLKKLKNGIRRIDIGYLVEDYTCRLRWIVRGTAEIIAWCEIPEIPNELTEGL